MIIQLIFDILYAISQKDRYTYKGVLLIIVLSVIIFIIFYNLFNNPAYKEIHENNAKTTNDINTIIKSSS
jgi:hypothetical protein